MALDKSSSPDRDERSRWLRSDRHVPHRSCRPIREGGFVRTSVGYCGGMDDVEIAEAIAELLAGRSVACAESCTAGRIGETFAAVSGAANWFRGGLVAYQMAVKRRHLGVRAPSMFTEECAVEMARGAAAMFTADITVSTTGVVGDEPEDGVSPGTVIIATYVAREALVHTYRFTGNANQICAQARHQALADLLAAVQSPPRARPARHLAALPTMLDDAVR